ncbi:MAG: insulinase family protein, partial [bacterium]|nr:insulinase family protein [Candidatus Kapabacteria bacterium]
GHPAQSFVEHRLANGLDVILHEDHTTPIVTINVLYHVGSKNEQRGRTGFAHLFEHLMFDGSLHVPRGGYDLHCTSVGGDNNAFTNADITDYFITLPREQLALGLWLESDRMAEFAIQEISLETQKSVVLEEKRQTSDDAPYGDLTQVMAELAFDHEHPYSWDTIGIEDDVRAATMTDVRDFYQRFYLPSNATIVIGGDFDSDEAMRLVHGYFGSIPAGAAFDRPQPNPAQHHYGMRRRVESHIIPFNAAFLGYHTPGIYDNDIYALELLVTILADGESSRLYRALEYDQEIASETECFIEEGELGSTMFIYAIGQTADVTPEQLEKALRDEIAGVVKDGVTERELQKAKNRKLTVVVNALQSISTRTERLAFYKALYNDPALAFSEASLYENITTDDIQRVAQRWLANVEPNVVEYVASSKFEA